MRARAAVRKLVVLAEYHRYVIFYQLVQAGPDGMSAGRLAEAVSLKPNALTFHFKRLLEEEFVAVRRRGRSRIYTARHDTMEGLFAFLNLNCRPDKPR
jgi:ArsR family transcriptional regulator